MCGSDEKKKHTHTSLDQSVSWVGRAKTLPEREGEIKWRKALEGNEAQSRLRRLLRATACCIFHARLCVVPIYISRALKRESRAVMAEKLIIQSFDGYIHV